MKVIGIDPHFTKLAFSVISYSEEEGRKHLNTTYIPTPNLKKGIGNLKKNAETNYKLRQIFTASFRFFSEHLPDAIGVEAYQTIAGKTAHAPKMIAAVAAVKCAAFAVGKMPMEYSSSEMRRMVLGKASGTKEEMWNHVFPQYPNVVWPVVAEGNLEHIYDSLVIAEATLLEIMERNQMDGTEIG